MIKHNYKNLDIWKIAIDIANDCFLFLDKFPDKEKYGLYSQISRSSVSISSNIAEGSSRSEKSFIHFLSISLGSSFELESQLIISNKRGYLSNIDLKSILTQLNKFQRKTITFQKKLENKVQLQASDFRHHKK